MSELHLTKKDFRVDWFSGTGAGGQYRNKHRNCCRITHLGSGIATTGQSHRSRPANQKEAFDKLVRILIARNTVVPERRTGGERIRTYHAVRNAVVDHASGLVQSYRKVVEGADIADMIEARKQAVENQRNNDAE